MYVCVCLFGVFLGGDGGWPCYGNVLKSGILHTFLMPWDIVLKSSHASDRLVLMHLNFYASLNTHA